jgi:hypothetical protein
LPLYFHCSGADGSYSWWPLEVAADLFTSPGYNSTRDLVMVILGYDDSQDYMIRQTVQGTVSGTSLSLF